ncbi:ABC transporter ATP-binding protein [bacterium]|nr:ABC transporter ATP-binding protein [bacterium]
MKPIIEVKSISKSYVLSGKSDYYFALRDSLAALIQRPGSFLARKTKQISESMVFWALKDVTFSVEPGEIVGVIGRNGAGKSTLLKILNRITEPTDGEVVIRGRISSLLEVGTGFHPELTGRENIYFSGAILGMKRSEIARKFDEIVAFAEVDKFLDTPVKRYSSGMQVRLAFSVAVHMEPDILLIDEVLAVGDAEFQRKCLAKIHESARKYGRTILFVSHNLDVVQSLCDRSVLLEEGQVRMVGPTSEVVSTYLERMEANSGVARIEFPEDSSKGFELKSVTVRGGDGQPATTFEPDVPFRVDVEYEVRDKKSKFWITASCTNEHGALVFYSRDTDKNPNLLARRKEGIHRSVFTFPSNSHIAMNVGNYSLTVRIEQDPSREAIIPLQITNVTNRFSHHHHGVMLVESPWDNTESS